MWYKVTASFSCPLQAMVFAQLCTFSVLAQNSPVKDFTGRELHLPSILLSHPGACQGLGEEAPGDSHCFPVVQDETLQGKWQEGRCSGNLGAVLWLCRLNEALLNLQGKDDVYDRMLLDYFFSYHQFIHLLCRVAINCEKFTETLVKMSKYQGETAKGCFFCHNFEYFSTKRYIQSF